MGFPEIDDLVIRFMMPSMSIHVLPFWTPGETRSQGSEWPWPQHRGSWGTSGLCGLKFLRISFRWKPLEMAVGSSVTMAKIQVYRDSLVTLVGWCHMLQLKDFPNFNFDFRWCLWVLNLETELRWFKAGHSQNFQGNFQVFQFQNAWNNGGTQEAPKVLDMHPLHAISFLRSNMFKLFHCQLAFFAEEFALSNRRCNKHRHVWASSNAAGAHPKIWWNIHDAPSRLCHVERTLIGETGDGMGDDHTNGNLVPWSDNW